MYSPNSRIFHGFHMKTVDSLHLVNSKPIKKKNILKIKKKKLLYVNVLLAYLLRILAIFP